MMTLMRMGQSDIRKVMKLMRMGQSDIRKVMTLMMMGQSDIQKVMTSMRMGQSDIRKVMTLVRMGQSERSPQFYISQLPIIRCMAALLVVVVIGVYINIKGGKNRLVKIRKRKGGSPVN